MVKLKNFPRALFRKALLTLLTGAGCFLFGVAYYLYAADRIFLILSCMVLLISLYKCFHIYSLVIKKRYETVEGICVGITSKMIGKCNKVKMMDEDGIESTLYLSKNSKLKIGHRYKLYFSQAPQINVGSEYLNTALATDSFLGFEDMGEFEKES